MVILTGAILGAGYRKTEEHADEEQGQGVMETGQKRSEAVIKPGQSAANTNNSPENFHRNIMGASLTITLHISCYLNPVAPLTILLRSL